MNPETELTVASVLRRNAHELRNKLSALISAVDVMGSLATASPPIFEEALSLLAESGTDLRELADTWTRSAVDMFEQSRSDINGDQLADLVAEGIGFAVGREPTDFIVRVDPQIISVVARRIDWIIEPRSVRVSQLVRHDLPFMAVVFETTAERAAAAIDSEPVVAMLNQLSAHPRIDGDTLVLQLPAQRAAATAAA